MRRHRRRAGRLFWKVLAVFVILLFAGVATSAYLLTQSMTASLEQESSLLLRDTAIVIRDRLDGTVHTLSRSQLASLAWDLANAKSSRIMQVTFVDAKARVLADSRLGEGVGDAVLDRPEIRAALTSGWGTATRWSTDVGQELQYVALGLGPADAVDGAVRIATATPSALTSQATVRRTLMIIGAVVMASTGILAVALSRMLSRPIREINAIAGRISSGDLSARARIAGTDELAQLAAALNDMRDHIQRQIHTIDFHRQTLETLLNQLREGLVVTGPDGHIIVANPAAVRLLSVPTDPSPESSTVSIEGSSWTGRPIEHCIPQHEVQRLLLPSENVSDPRALPDAVRIEVSSPDGPKVLDVVAADITLPTSPGHSGFKSTGTNIGRAITLTDITQVARTLQMKTDFASNASHELRTPLSAIRGAVETILEITDGIESAPLRRFIGVIDRHCGRLEELVHDLLALARVESPTSSKQPARAMLSDFATALEQRWQDVAAERGVTYSQTMDGLEDTTVDPQLAALALDNLIDNAIKFTDRGGTVSCRFAAAGARIRIEVTDTGVGIPEEHQERVFERFYQVASSRTGMATRGTGLGLAIVRHATAAMHGTVGLWSEPGRGTRITLDLPSIPG